MKKQQFLIIVATAIMLIPAFGCSPAARRETGYVGNVTSPDVAGDIGPNRDVRNNSAYAFRPDLADHIRTQIPGITQASVFVRSNNAYVAVTDGTLPRTGNVERIVPRDRVVPQGDTTRTAPGTVPVPGIPGGPTTGRVLVPGMPGGPTTGRVPVPGIPGGPATGIPSVDGRTGGYTGGVTGFTGSTGGQTAVPFDMKQRIMTEVRRVDPAIKNVYVSDDPALLSRFRGYGTGSIRSTADDFNNIIRQFFPRAR